VFWSWNQWKRNLRHRIGSSPAKLQGAAVGSSVRIQQEFGNDREYSLLLDVRDEDFDPASADPELTDGAG